MAGAHIVYLDSFLAVNLLMNYLILWTTAKLCRLPVSVWRLLTGAAAGTACSLTVIFPLTAMNMFIPLKLFFSVLMILIAFYPLGIRNLLRVVLFFYLTAFAMGGTVMGVIYLTGGDISSVTVAWLLTAAVTAVLLARWGVDFIRHHSWQGLFQLPVIINFAGQEAALKALVDTGNSLRDPLSHKPVIIVEYGVLVNILPAEIIQEYSSSPEPNLDNLVRHLEKTQWATRLRLLPYQSLGNSGGMLLGLRPDEVIINPTGKIIKIKEVIVGLYKEQLSPEGNYRALLHPDLLQSSTSH